MNSNENNTRFCCETCGAINGVDDIVEEYAPKMNAMEEGKDEDAHFEYYLKAAEQGHAKAKAKLEMQF